MSLVLSPWIKEYAKESCRALGLHGGCVTDLLDSTRYIPVKYVRSEGISMPRIVHVQETENIREHRVFTLDEVDGHYKSGNLRLWPLCTMKDPLEDVLRRLPVELVGSIASFIEDELPSPVPTYANQNHLKTQVLCNTGDPIMWVKLWVGQSRPKQTSWTQRKSRRLR